MKTTGKPNTPPLTALEQLWGCSLDDPQHIEKLAEVRRQREAGKGKKTSPGAPKPTLIRLFEDEL